MPYTYFSSLIHHDVLRRVCPHLHGTIDEAWRCALEQQAEWGVKGATVVGAEMGDDGVPRHRDLTPSEQEQFDGIRGDA